MTTQMMTLRHNMSLRKVKVEKNTFSTFNGKVCVERRRRPGARAGRNWPDGPSAEGRARGVERRARGGTVKCTYIPWPLTHIQLYRGRNICLTVLTHVALSSGRTGNFGVVSLVIQIRTSREFQDQGTRVHHTRG